LHRNYHNFLKAYGYNRYKSSSILKKNIINLNKNNDQCIIFTGFKTGLEKLGIKAFAVALNFGVVACNWAAPLLSEEELSSETVKDGASAMLLLKIVFF
jgi:hypothetical protein